MQKINIWILAIESSCDDTSCAVLCNDVVYSNVTAGQDIHREYGGVVPELASRDHQRSIVPVVDAALKRAGISLSDLDAIAVTSGPGLMGSLLVGLSFAKSLSLSLEIPLIQVHHMQAHVLAHFIQEKDLSKKEVPHFPFLCLTVSGGHTQIVKVKEQLSMQILGETIDDAVGEAFDKAAKILGLPYPGGPLIDKLARQGDPDRFRFAHTKVDGYNYSFSGIKTSFLYFIRDQVKNNPEFISENMNDICASYQSHLIKVLLKNVKLAIETTGISELAIAGGVSANSGLRAGVEKMAGEMKIKVFIPRMEYCTDNAAMVGITAYYKFLKKEFSGLDLVPSTRSEL